MKTKTAMMSLSLLSALFLLSCNNDDALQALEGKHHAIRHSIIRGDYFADLMQLTELLKKKQVLLLKFGEGIDNDVQYGEWIISTRHFSYNEDWGPKSPGDNYHNALFQNNTVVMGFVLLLLDKDPALAKAIAKKMKWSAYMEGGAFSEIMNYQNGDTLSGDLIGRKGGIEGDFRTIGYSQDDLDKLLATVTNSGKKEEALSTEGESSPK